MIELAEKQEDLYSRIKSLLAGSTEDYDSIREAVTGGRKAFRSSKKKVVEEFIASATTIFREQATPLIPEAESLGELSPGTLEGRVTICLDRSIGVNGHTKPISSGRWEVGINAGLAMFLHKITKAMAARIGVVDETNTILEDPSRQLVSQADAQVRKLAQEYWEWDPKDPAAQLQSLWNTHVIGLLDLSLSQIKLAEELLWGAEQFALAHELGHVLLRLSPTQPIIQAYAIVGVATARAVLQTVAPGDAQWENTEMWNWGREFAADRIGLDICCAASGRPDSGSPDPLVAKWMSYTGAVLLLASVNVLEEYRVRQLRQRGEDEPVWRNTHPPADLRLVAFDVYARDGNAPEFFMLSDALRMELKSLTQNPT